MKDHSKSKYWVHTVTSDAMDLPRGMFHWSSKRIAMALALAVLTSDRTRGTKFQSAMSMLNFYINRQGKNLTSKDKVRLERAKGELRKLFRKN